MALPNVITYALAASSSTSVVNAAATVAVGTNFTLATTLLDNQRRILFTFSGDEHLNTFKIVGLNQANMTISETVNGTNATTAQSVLDYKTLNTITAVGSTAATVSIGTNGSGSCLWQIMNWHCSPFNVAAGIAVQSGSANFSVQYTYDDPNNLPSGVSAPQPFTLPTINGTTSSCDGAINDPVSAVRLLVNSGTGTLRATFIQAGLGSP